MVNWKKDAQTIHQASGDADGLDFDKFVHILEIVLGGTFVLWLFL